MCWGTVCAAEEKNNSSVQGACELLAAAVNLTSSVQGEGELLPAAEKYNSCFHFLGCW